MRILKTALARKFFKWSISEINNKSTQCQKWYLTKILKKLSSCKNSRKKKNHKLYIFKNAFFTVTSSPSHTSQYKYLKLQWKNKTKKISSSNFYANLKYMYEFSKLFKLFDNTALRRRLHYRNVPDINEFTR